MPSEISKKLSEIARDIDQDTHTENIKLKSELASEKQKCKVLEAELARLKDADGNGRLKEENDRLKRAWHEYELVSTDREPEVLQYLYVPNPPPLNPAPRAGNFAVQFFASRAENEPHPGGWAIMEDDENPEKAEFPGPRVQQLVTAAGHAGIEPKIKIKGAETWDKIMETLLPHHAVVNRARPTMLGPILPRFKEYVERHLQPWWYASDEAKTFYESVTDRYWTDSTGEIWGIDTGHKPNFQGHSGDASRSFEQLFHRIEEEREYIQGIRDIVDPFLADINTFTGQTVVSTHGAWGTSEKIYKGAGIQVTIDIGSKLWFIDCPGAAFGVDLVYTGQGDCIVLGPGTQWKSYAIEPTIMHVHHVMDNTWLARDAGQPKDLVVKVFYCLMAWAIGEKSEINNDLAGAKVVLEQLGAYATLPGSWGLNDLAKQALRPWLVLFSEQTVETGSQQGKRKDRDEEGGNSNKKSRTAGRIAMSISDSEDNQ